MSTLQVGDWHAVQGAGADRPQILELMELAASRAMQRVLGAWERSIGVALDVRRAGGGRMGEPVLAAATFLGRDGELYRFSVEAFDDDGPIGRGVHTRAVLPA